MSVRSKLSVAVLSLIAGGGGWLAISRQFVSEVEGYSLVAYRDAGGVPTICAGHTGPDVYMGLKLTKEQCDKLLEKDLAEAGRIVDRLVWVPMSPPRKAAVVSFGAINIGAGKLSKSTFLRKLNEGDAAACQYIKQWVFDGGRDCRLTKGQANGCYGQVVRRDMEAELCAM